MRFVDYPDHLTTRGLSELSREALDAIAAGYEALRKWVAQHPDITIVLPSQRPVGQHGAPPLYVHDEVCVLVPSEEQQAAIADELSRLVLNPIRCQVVKPRAPSTALQFSISCTFKDS